jgi:hypothetical protein
LIKSRATRERLIFPRKARQRTKILVSLRPLFCPWIAARLPLGRLVRVGHRPAALANPVAIYATGLLGMGYADFYIFLIPLYALSLGMSAGDRRACWRPPSAAGVLVDPCRRLDGPVRDTAGQPVFCLVGDSRHLLAS